MARKSKPTRDTPSPDRRKVVKTVTLRPETLEGLDDILALIPALGSRSSAIDHAVAIAVRVVRAAEGKTDL